MSKKVISRILTMFLFMCMMFNQLSAQTQIDQDWVDAEYNEANWQEWWDDENGYVVIEDIIITGTVQIPSFVTIQLNQWCSIFVRDGGVIEALEATFTSSNAASYDWVNIVFNAEEEGEWEAAGDSYFNACIFNHFDGPAIQVFGGSVDIDECEFTADATEYAQEVNYGCVSWDVNNNEFVVWSNNIFTSYNDEPAVLITNGKVKFVICDFEGDGENEGDTGLEVSGWADEVEVEQCSFREQSTAIDHSTGETTIWKCYFFANQAGNSTAMIIVGTADVYCNTIEDYTTAIVVENSNSPEFHNNFISNCGTGIEVIEDSNPRIFNNAIFEITGDAITGTQNSEPDIIYNTIFNIGGSCIFLDQDEEESGQAEIYNNVFSKWVDFAIEYSGEPGQVNCDRNLYSTPDPDEMVEIDGGEGDDDRIEFEDFWGEGCQGYLSAGVESPNGGPDEVLIRRYGDDYGDAENLYNPFTIEGGLERDDIDCFVFSDENQYDFHLYAVGTGNWDDPETDAIIPVWVNEGFSSSWWAGDEQGTGHDDGREWVNGFSDPDMGVYSGPWADEFGDLTDFGNVNHGTQNDYRVTYNWIRRVEDVYDVNDWHDFYRVFGDGWISPNQGRGIWDALADNGHNLLMFDEDCSLIISNTCRFNNLTVTCYDPTATYESFTVTDTVNADSVSFNNCMFVKGNYGLKLMGVDDVLGSRVSIDSCTFDSCGTGIYATNSRVKITNSTIQNCGDGSLTYGTYFNSCSAGKVILDNNTITNNGVGSTYMGAGVFLDSSSPEIVNNTIENSTGSGIACIGSSPDLDTYDAMGNEFNNIHANGSGTQSGSSGAEIYLANSSYPSIKYNNIWDYDTGPVGVMVYKDETSNSGVVYATNNWWGNSTVTDSYFFWGLGSAIDYSYYSTTQLSSFEEYELAMGYWDEGEYEDAARIFRSTVLDDCAVGVNSVHYLAGCVGEMEDGNFLQLRSFLQDVAAEHEDEEVAKVANRFATHCLTELREYDDAMAEYDYARNHADCLRDSVDAVIDYLAVCELAGGGDLDAASGDIPTQMHNLMELLEERTAEGSTDILLPEDFMVVEAYPNPFNSTTTIAYNLSMSGEVRLSIHDIQGRLISILQDGVQTAGYKKAIWDAGDQPSGLYLCRMESKGKVATTKLTLVK